MKYETTLYGELTKLHSKRAWVNLTSGEKVSFPIKEDHYYKLQSRLNKTIGVEGNADCDTQSYKIKSFRLKRITEYQDGGNIAEVFKKLSELSGGFWDTLTTNEEINEYLGRNE